MNTVRIETLAPNPWNPNTVSAPEEDKLRVSLRKFGVFKPIIVRELDDGTLQILGGEHRWRAAQAEGYVEVPVANLGRIDDKAAKEIGLADNARYGHDDTLALAQLLGELDLGELTEFLPVTNSELDSIAAAASIALDELDDDSDSLDDLAGGEKPAATTQLMRFKVPVEDVQWISLLIEREMKANDFTDEDALSNAGNALVNLLHRCKEALK